MIVGAVAFVFNAPRNVHALELARVYEPQSALTLDQLDQLSAEMEGRRAAIFLLGAARNAERGKGDEAIQYQRQVLDLLQDRGLAHYLRPDETRWVIAARSFACEVAYSRERFADVLAYAERVLEIAPDDYKGLIWKGHAQARLGKYTEADRLFDRALALYPDSLFVLNQVAYFYFFWSPQRAWKTRALALINHILEIAPSDPGGLHLLTLYRMDENRCSEAFDAAQTLVEVDRENGNAWATLGNVYWCLGKKDLARQNYQRAIKLAPSLAPYYEERLRTP